MYRVVRIFRRNILPPFSGGRSSDWGVQARANVNARDRVTAVIYFGDSVVITATEGGRAGRECCPASRR